MADRVSDLAKTYSDYLATTMAESLADGQREQRYAMQQQVKQITMLQDVISEQTVMDEAEQKATSSMLLLQSTTRILNSLNSPSGLPSTWQLVDVHGAQLQRYDGAKKSNWIEMLRSLRDVLTSNNINPVDHVTSKLVGKTIFGGAILEFYTEIYETVKNLCDGLAWVHAQFGIRTFPKRHLPILKQSSAKPVRNDAVLEAQTARHPGLLTSKPRCTTCSWSSTTWPRITCSPRARCAIMCWAACGTRTSDWRS